MTHCQGCLDRIMHWTFGFYLLAYANFRICMISVYLANARTTRIKIKIEPSFTQRFRAMLACPKMAIAILNAVPEYGTGLPDHQYIGLTTSPCWHPPC